MISKVRPNSPFHTHSPPLLPPSTEAKSVPFNFEESSGEKNFSEDYKGRMLFPKAKLPFGLAQGRRHASTL